MQSRQMLHIRGRIRTLVGRQWAARPIGAGLPLVYRDLQTLRHQSGITDLRHPTQQGMRGLGVVQRLQMFYTYRCQNLLVLSRRMHDLGQRQVQQLHQGGQELHALRIDQGHRIRCSHLHQAQLRIVGALAHEFGIQAEPRL